jgi:cytoskeletal protein CcmA (bactofilin family)
MEKLQSFLGSKSEFHGELKINGVLRLDGAVSGRIEADQVILSETAFFKGEIIAKKIIVGGLAEGILRASDLLEIGSKGRVQGDIFTNKLAVVNGGQFNGRIDMNPSQSNVLDFETKGREISLKR